MDRTISSSKADTSGIRWSMSVGESLAVSFFSPKGVLKERSKTERVMKTSIAPFFGLKQTNKQSTILVRQTHQTQFLLLGNGILEWWAHLQQFDLQTNAMATGSLGASPDSHAPWEQPCRLYRLWLEITLSCWRAKVSATMRVTHKMNACHQPPIVKTKKMKTKRKPFVFSIQFVWWQNKQWVLLWSKCSKVGEQSPQSALITAYILFPRSGITQKGYSEQRSRQSPPGRLISEDIRKNMWYQEAGKSCCAGGWWPCWFSFICTSSWAALGTLYWNEAPSPIKRRVHCHFGFMLKHN